MKFLVLGNKGQLGSRIAKDLKAFGAYVYSCDKDEVDITDYKKIKFLINDYLPQTIINCAAYNNVEEAESQTEIAFAVNSKAPEYLAELANNIYAKLVHYSTDYVFDGKANAPYKELDETNPINEYGKSKLLGECAVEQIAKRYIIFRTSWLYSNGNENFIGKFLKNTQLKKEVFVVNNEVSIPTSAKFVVDITLKSLEQDLEGLFHLTNSGKCSRLEYAKFIIDTLSLDNKLSAINQEDLNLKAKRPEYSVLDNINLKKILNTDFPVWETEVQETLLKYYDR